jgi:hypothetical protein
MVSVIYLGRAPGSSATDLGVIGAGTQRANRTDATSQHLWLRRLGGRIGPQTAGSTSVKLVAYNAGSGDPSGADLLAQTASFTASTTMGSASQGANEERDVTTPVQIWSGSRILLDLVAVSGNTLGHGMVQAANLPGSSPSDRNFYSRSTATVADPFGAYSAAYEGQMSLWALCHANEAPHTPVNRTATNLESLTPTFGADFRDDNGEWGGANDSGDEMSKYRIQVRRVSDGVTFWNPAAFTASSSERAVDRLERVYAGTTLVRGTTYEWRVQVADEFGAWSDWSSWLTFTIASAGTVTAISPPSGKQETVTPSPFTGQWTHATALAMTHAQLRISEGGSVVRASGDIAKAVSSSAAPGTSFTVTWAESGFTALSPGGSYTFELRGKDSGGTYSAWSNAVAFTVNAAPTVPSNTEPDSMEVKTSSPLITFDMSDPDDTTGTGLGATVEVYDASNALVESGAATHTGGERWSYQTALASFGTYHWRAIGYDGTFYSGGAITVAADAVWSVPQHFQYLAGPSLSIVAPADGATVDTSTPTFEWSAPTQTAFKLRVYDRTTGALIRATNGGEWAVSAAQTYTHPAGYLTNGGLYRWEIEVQDAAALTALAGGDVDVVFTPPDDVAGFAALPYLVASDPWATAIRLEWEASTDPDFVSYDLYRDDLAQPLARLTSASETAWIDMTPPSGRTFTYTLRVVAQIETEQISSAGTSAEAQIDLGGVVLTSVADPATVRAILTRVTERTLPRRGSEAVYTPWGALTEPTGAPTTIKGKARWWEIEGVYYVAADAAATAEQRIAEIEALDASDTQTFCYRDERGRRLFVTIPADDGLVFRDRRLGRAEVTMRLREEKYVEGVS